MKIKKVVFKRFFYELNGLRALDKRFLTFKMILKNFLLEELIAMNLVRWSPFHDMTLLQNQMNRLFDNTLQGWSGDGTAGWLPSADIYETDNDLVVAADLPGVEPQSVDVRVENNVLTIRGERRFEQSIEKENFHRAERSYGTFARAFTLSTAVDTEKIRAGYKNGVLTITLPKAEAAKPKHIQIAAATTA
jgi:HSP20 family protein